MIRNKAVSKKPSEQIRNLFKKILDKIRTAFLLDVEALKATGAIFVILAPHTVALRHEQPLASAGWSKCD
jgi:hypothetical protein